MSLNDAARTKSTDCRKQIVNQLTMNGRIYVQKDDEAFSIIIQSEEDLQCL